ncbi:MAG: S-layer homology domain-containing protein [Candidatus Gastranaerophilales bacterium]|nr:S-layer homology domain-containing protein [Candidatus Gastranaerophilales bacterium]
MTIKKLTVAAAIAVGITTCSFAHAMAACPCNQDPVVTAPSCGCAQERPVVTGQACPCEATKPTCSDPTVSTLCPSTLDLTKSEMKQIYAYPNAIYGNNNYIGEESTNGIFRGDGFSVSPRRLSETTSGSTVASDGSITGAASSIPCINEMTSHNGVPILRDERKMDNNCTPIKMETQNSLEAIKKTLVPYDLNKSGCITGGAADLSRYDNSSFPDVPSGYWASCDITKLAMNDVVVGYPDRLFKPSRNISRAEFATMLVKGFNKEDCASTTNCFKDVPQGHWANSMIGQAVHENLLKGYPNGLFKPSNPVTRAEVLCAIAKALPCEIDQCKAQEILSKYCDGKTVPGWAQVPIAKALDQGVLNNTPNPNLIAPFKDASRADVASMLQAARIAGGFDKNPATANNCCPPKDDRTAYVENQEIVKIPTLQLEFKDQINAKSSHVGQKFAAETLEEVTIDGNVYPAGSKVTGKVVEVIRPSGCQKGALKLAFTEIEYCGCKANLPKQILTAQIDKANTPNIISRIVTAPFTWAGSMVGIVGRTTGGMLSNLGNAVEDVSSGVGIALGETFQGQFGAAGRSIADATIDTLKAPIDFTRTALSGSMGLLQSTGDEVAYMVDAKGYKISAINPKEHVTIAFGCSE